MDTIPLLSFENLRQQLTELSQIHQNNRPFPHTHFSNFIDIQSARRLASQFPRPEETHWIQYKHFNENKLGKTNRTEFPPLIGQLIDELNSELFVSWLSELTGIANLKSDPSLEGGGIQQTEPGGFLNIHADFTHHHHQRNWRRRCNLILYLNENWKEDWGGAIELWDRTMKHCKIKIPPLLNHAILFNTTEEAFHGYPDAITCPEGVTRKSLALYYYTLEERAHAIHSTNYQARPSDNFWRATLIWIDKKILALYSKIKRKLGLSDDFASSILSFFGSTFE